MMSGRMALKKLSGPDRRLAGTSLQAAHGNGDVPVSSAAKVRASRHFKMSSLGGSRPFRLRVGAQQWLQGGSCRHLSRPISAGSLSATGVKILPIQPPGCSIVSWRTLGEGQVFKDIDTIQPGR